MNTSFDRSITAKDEWLTPRYILEALGEFDLDPCSPIDRPWPTAKVHYTINDIGLMKDWFGRVWLNPPYGRETGYWLRKLKMHGNGIALVFCRTDTPYFHDAVFGGADALFFIRKRIKFCHVDGTESENEPGAPSVLIAYGIKNASILASSPLVGSFVRLNPPALNPKLTIRNPKSI